MPMKRQTILKGMSFSPLLVFALVIAGLSSPVLRLYGQAPAYNRLSSGKIVPETSELKAHIERYTADRRSLDRYYDFNFSKGRFSRYEDFYREWIAILDGVDFNSFGQDGRIDYLLFKNFLQREQKRLEQEKADTNDVLPLLPFAETIINLRENLKKMHWIDGKKAAGELNSLRIQIENAKKTLESQKVSKSTANLRRAVSISGILRQSLKDWFDFYNGYDPLFTWWVSEPYQAADKVLQSYEEAFRRNPGEDRAGGPSYAIKDPVGREVLLEELAFEMIPYTPEEILAIGRQELAWCEKERLIASREIGYGDDWKKAVEHVKNKCVEPGEQPELIRFLAFEAIDFLEKHDLLTIPPMVKDLIRMEMMPLVRQQTTPFFTGGEVISVAYPADSVPYERKISTMRGNNPHFSRAVVHHELVPGHNLQGFMAARHRTYRRPFQTSFYGEGWPLYWEMYLWDMEFQRSPEDRIGMLFWRMHRCARIIFSMSYHLGKMSVDDCIDFLVDRIGHEKPLAEVEVKAHLSGRAYGGQPLAQISYLTGGLQMRALSRELVDSGKMTAKEFHNAVLRENSIPIELLRAKLTGQQLTPDFKSRWKFYAVLENQK